MEIESRSSGLSAEARSRMNDDRLTIAGVEFRSRLWVGTGRYKDVVEAQKALEASGADVVTVAVRRVNITDRKTENLLDYISPKKYKILPNTAGCYTVEDALRYARLARAAGVSDMVKLEVIGDERTLFPDTAGVLRGGGGFLQERVFLVSLTPTEPRLAPTPFFVRCPPPVAP